MKSRYCAPNRLITVKPTLHSIATDTLVCPSWRVKKMRQIAVVVIALGSIFDASSAAIGGWREFQWDMNRNQVQSVAKGPIRDPSKEEVARGKDGVVIGKVLGGFELAGFPFEANLMFCSELLCRIGLAPKGELPPRASGSVYSQLLSSLKQKYGEPTRSDVSDMWVSGDTLIKLTHIGMINVVLVNYEHVPSSAENL